MRLRAIGGLLAYFSVVSALGLVVYSLLSENLYLRKAHLINFDDQMKKFIHIGMIAAAVIAVLLVAALFPKPIVSAVSLVVVSVLLLGLQTGILVYWRRMVPNAAYGKIWTTEFAPLVQDAIYCCGFESKEESPIECVPIKTCKKKIGQQMEDREKVVLGCVSSSFFFHISTAIAVVLILSDRQVGRKYDDYKELPHDAENDL